MKIDEIHGDLTVPPPYLSVLQSKSNLELLEEIDKMLSHPVEEIDGDFVDACLEFCRNVRQ